MDKIQDNSLVLKDSITETSLYNLTTDWSNSNGKVVKLESNLGNYVVMAMVYSSCQYSCPRILEEMRKIENSIPKEKIENSKFLLVSIDPENDTPEKMNEFAEEEGFDTNRWQLLSSNSENTRELANLINFKYVKNDNGSFSHSNLIVILNKNGEVIKTIEGFDNKYDDIDTIIK